MSARDETAKYNTGEMLYTYSDYLGNIMHITDENGNVIHEQSFDAWGRDRDPDSYENFPSSAGQGNVYTNDRGYTGHEMLPQFGIINMNGRLYDPITGRMLSPDPYIQMPDYSQNFNRYSYVLNNPLKFTDPNGEKWTWKHWLGVFVTFGLLPAGTAETMISTIVGKASVSGTIGFLDGGIEEAKKRANNSWQISQGLYDVDEEKGNSFEQFLQLLSRHTWQQPMTLLGYEYANYSNNTARIDVSSFHGATVIQSESMPSAVSIGGYITINPNYGAIDHNNNTLLHEYGHFIQQRNWGGLAYIPGALLSVGSASGFNWRSTSSHQEIWIEQDANARTWNYFNEVLSPAQRTNFMSSNYYRNREYHELRFLRNIIFPDLLTLYLIDVTWSN